MTIAGFFSTVLTLLLIATPASAIPILLALTPGQSVRSRIRTAQVACLIAALILSIFALSGNSIFHFFGISMQAFKIAGGIYLVCISLSLMKGSDADETVTAEQSGVAPKGNVAITPLGIPIICGPGMISTTLLVGADLTTFMSRLMLVGAVLLALFGLYLCLLLSAKYAKHIKPFALRIAERLTGLYVCALGFLIFFSGLEIFLERGSNL